MMQPCTRWMRRPHLRKFFEALHDGMRPMTITLSKRLNLDAVRVI